MAIAEGANSGSSEQMMLANVGPGPLPIQVPQPPPPVSVAAVPAVRVTLYPFGREGPDTTANANDNALLYTRIEAINSAVPTAEDGHVDWIDTAAAETAARPTKHYLKIGPSTAPQLSLVQWANTDDKLGTEPKRGLSLKTEDWTVSASARIPLLRSHELGATIYVKRRF
ncbi:hypothetical protein [Pandoraea terrigena]|uniref:hypothetical protein n=1 Tax=Pandoraea terrigena TaxID=2508292 RepID=UPI0012420235|nr:hypothetical protein [Pandoraea terrigena]